MSYQATETEKKCKECDSFIAPGSIFTHFCSETCRALDLLRSQLKDEQIKRAVVEELHIRVVTSALLGYECH
jgi:endogenous inhibitor of DNA gyrase (YacG/DUF329 family)